MIFTFVFLFTLSIKNRFYILITMSYTEQYITKNRLMFLKHISTIIFEREQISIVF